jgi:hypothetical protein
MSPRNVDSPWVEAIVRPKSLAALLGSTRKLVPSTRSSIARANKIALRITCIDLPVSFSFTIQG